MESRMAKHEHLVGGVVFINEVPRLQSGKIQRKIMRQGEEGRRGKAQGWHDRFLSSDLTQEPMVTV